MNRIKIGLIGGSGLGQALGAVTEGTRHDIDTPFGKPSDAIVETEWAGLPLLFLSRHGQGHLLNPSQVPFRANIFALKQLGCTHILASGAVGSLREEMKPRDLVIPDQIIDKTSRRVGTFYEKAAVHVEMGEPFCPVLRRILVEASEDSGFTVKGSGLANQPREQKTGEEEDAAGKAQATSLNPEPRTLNPLPIVHHRGCYVCMEGPAFSTRAESLMHRLWGGDLIGMSLMPEARLAREAEISYAAVALVTDYDCWRQNPAIAPAPDSAAPGVEPDKTALLAEIIGNLQAATDNAIALLRRAVDLLAQRREQLPASPAHRALELAIWSNKAQIPPDEVQRLAPLWIKYFE